jgi:hypothetical protein
VIIGKTVTAVHSYDLPNRLTESFFFKGLKKKNIFCLVSRLELGAGNKVLFIYFFPFRNKINFVIFFFLNILSEISELNVMLMALGLSVTSFLSFLSFWTGS